MVENTRNTDGGSGVKPYSREALSESNKRLELALNTSQLGYYELDLATGRITCTAQCKANYGLSADETLNREVVSAAILPKYHPYIQSQLNNAFIEHTDYKAEYEIEWPDKTVHWLRASGFARYNDAGEPITLVGVTLDITEAKKAEEKQALLAAVINTSQDAIISKTLDGLITSFNKAAERMFGYTEQEIIGEHISILIPPSRSSEEEIILSNISQGLAVNHFETIRLTKDGQEVPISLTVSPIKNSAGEIIGASKIARNIGDQKLAHERQAVLAAIVDTSDDAIVSKTLKGIITSWNKAAERMFGYAEDEAVGKHISLIIPKLRLNEEEHIIGQIAQGNKVDHFETMRVTKSGKEIPISLSVSPLKDKNGKVIGASKIARDISEQKEARETMARLYEEIRTLNNKKDEFIGMASHELKTPLTSITGYLQLLERNQTTDVNKNFVKKILSQIGKLNNLVAELLDVSKIEAGKLQLAKIDYDLKSSLQDVIDLLQHSERHQIIFETCLQEARIYADKLRIEQLVINLLTNARKYSPNADRVILSLSGDDNLVSISVQDFGIGIAKKNHPHIFSRFYRVNELSPHLSGLGIGLYISKEIAERHNGTISVESELGKGSIFTVTIPKNSALTQEKQL